MEKCVGYGHTIDAAATDLINELLDTCTIEAAYILKLKKRVYINYTLHGAKYMAECNVRSVGLAAWGLGLCQKPNHRRYSITIDQHGSVKVP